MKVLRLGKVLSDQFRARRLAADFYQAAVGAVREQELADARNHSGIDQPGKDGHEKRDAESWTNLVAHKELLRGLNGVRPLRRAEEPSAPGRALLGPTPSATSRATGRSARCPGKAQ